MSNMLAAIRAREAKIDDVRTEVIGTIDGTPARFCGVGALRYFRQPGSGATRKTGGNRRSGLHHDEIRFEGSSK